MRLVAVFVSFVLSLPLVGWYVQERRDCERAGGKIVRTELTSACVAR